jgi:ATP-dependent Lon protease
VPNNLHGIHIHCGDGSIQKSGTSAGIAITILIYSVINQRKINNPFAVTGEANLDGSVNEIGALSNKIVGGIKSGVTHFLYPQENSQDFDEFWEIYKDNKIVQGIQFHPISTIREALDLILV